MTTDKCFGTIFQGYDARSIAYSGGPEGNSSVRVRGVRRIVGNEWWNGMGREGQGKGALKRIAEA